MNNGVIRTKKALRSALIDLLKEKEFRAITISEIASRAEYSRATFYAHYQYKEDLLDELVQEVIEGFLSAFKEPYENNRESYDLGQLTPSAIKIFQYIGENEDAFGLLLKGSNPGFQEKLFEAIRSIFTQEYELLFPRIPAHIDREIYINQNVYTMLGLISYWVNSDYRYSAKYMTDQMLAIAKLSNPR
ncbi:TetR/AcrR family transcriptional regulator [Cohnella thailandensis]|uniref:TetR/AcrR family transcriptional regulator n=1 Tax=Cohnella thailandensis TaxID=557557 RepID=A0A841T1C7_9BACL|nr:TetR/AcrR family transcriptional regulator [Cohnella thailandensis]MBB6638213.1 TetR/AcrR family transcriptional regulator [Cohnella thailandensis]MBP1977771.1 AcrR family transcriptional regulator [Cohnella thailandensis]